MKKIYLCIFKMIMRQKTTAILLILTMFATCIMGQIPAGYYNDAIGKSGYALQSALCQIIGNHNIVGYNELWYYYQFTDLKPDSTIWDIDTDPYCSFGIDDHGATGNAECVTYNREHAFCQSWFGGTSEPPVSDLHHIFPVSSWINSYRNNYPYGEVMTPDRQFQNGSKWGKNTFVSTVDQTPSGTAFEPIDEYKGDVARAIFYMSTRYMFEDSNFCTDASVAPMTLRSQLRPWALEMLKNWHIVDPVSQKEIDRNNAIYNIQHNRNPYIDHPQLVNLVWGNDSVQNVFDPGFIPVSHIHIKDLIIPNTTTIVIKFDTTIVPTSVTNHSNYTISNGIKIDSVNPTQSDALTIHLQNMLTPGYPYYMIVRNIQSVNGYFLQDTSLSFVYGYSSKHQPIVSWTFDTTLSAPNTPKVIAADINGTGFAATLFLEGSNGASDFNQENSFNEITTYPGTRIGDPRISNAYDGRALAITGSYTNGKSLVWKFSSQYWENLIITLANRRTPTGFFMHTWEYSLDGTKFDTLYNVTTVADSLNLFELKTIDLQQYNQFNRQQQIFLRLTIDSAYSVSGNNRFDNFTVFAQKCSDKYVYNDTILTNQPYEKYGFQIPPINGVGSLVFTRETEMEAACDSTVILNLTIATDTTHTNDNLNEVLRRSTPQLIIYPNPAKQSCKIKLTDMEDYNTQLLMQITTPTGQIILSRMENPNPFTGEIEFHAESLPYGIYLVTISGKNFTARGKMVIVK